VVAAEATGSSGYLILSGGTSTTALHIEGS